MISDDWIKNINREFRAEGIDQRRRPWEAIQHYSDEFEVSVGIPSDISKAIFKWFETHAKPGIHQVGSLYEAVYYYDSQFWVISIPIVFGAVRLDPQNSLQQMPDTIKQEMMSDNRQAQDYLIYWADCLDYGMGMDELRNTKHMNEFGIQLLLSADQELKAATSMLSQHSPGPRAILNCRMALEIFFKSYVALKKGLTDNQARNMGHDLNKGLDMFIAASGLKDWEGIRHLLQVFPKINERYKEQDISYQNLWNGYSLAHSVGSVVAREFTDRNTLDQIISTLQVS